MTLLHEREIAIILILVKILLSLQPFIVKLNALARGKSHLEWHCGREFFETFENTEILDASLELSLELDNHGLTIDVWCEISGSVTVACDRCLEDLELDVETSFDESYTSEGVELDLSQDIYDYVNIALPLQRVHPEGKCNSETIKFLNI